MLCAQKFTRLAPLATKMPAERKIVIRNKTIDGVRTAVEMDVTDRIPGKNTRKYIKSRQCVTVFKRGKMAGLRCSWHALKDSVHCKRHEGNHNPTNSEAREQGSMNFWARLRAIEAQNPGTIRRVLNVDKSLETRRRNREIEATLLPKPQTEDKIIIQAHKALVKEAAALPAIPDKPFDELAPHEQLVHNTRLALKRAHEILEVKLTEKKIKKQPKLASLVKDAAFRTIATAVKIDRNTLQERRIDKMGELLARLKAGDDAKVIEG